MFCTWTIWVNINFFQHVLPFLGNYTENVPVYFLEGPFSVQLKILVKYKAFGLFSFYYLS